jgi:beta-lactamase class D
MVFLVTVNVSSQKTEEKDFGKYFSAHNINGCFLLFDPESNLYIEYNHDRCDSEYIPASTFKILNSLIALEEGVIKDTAQVIPWDGYVWPNAEWNRDQTLVSAVRYSCIWVFFEIARKVGTVKYQEYLDTADYGNRDLSGPPDRFWLSGELRISAREQITFLRKFCDYDLPVSRENVDIVKRLITLEETPHYRLYGKTGAGRLGEDKLIMWFIGWVETEGRPCYFAMNYTTDDFKSTRKARLDITKNILTEMKLIR